MHTVRIYLRICIGSGNDTGDLGKNIIKGECVKDVTTHIVAPKTLAAAGAMISPRLVYQKYPEKVCGFVFVIFFQCDNLLNVVPSITKPLIHKQLS